MSKALPSPSRHRHHRFPRERSRPARRRARSLPWRDSSSACPRGRSPSRAPSLGRKQSYMSTLSTSVARTSCVRITPANYPPQPYRSQTISALHSRGLMRAIRQHHVTHLGNQRHRPARSRHWPPAPAAPLQRPVDCRRSHSPPAPPWMPTTAATTCWSPRTPSCRNFVNFNTFAWTHDR